MSPTPMIRQYLEAKSSHPESILFFRMGDFYEVFFDDAELVARELELTLTARGQHKGDPIPMAGVPHHSAEGYIRRLVSRGHRVAVCEQLEDPSASKGIVARGVVRVVTPGLTFDTEALDAKRNNFLAALAVSSLSTGDGYAVASLDVSTGELRVSEVLTLDALRMELLRLAPSEILVTERQLDVFAPVVDDQGVMLTERPDDAIRLDRVIARSESVRERDDSMNLRVTVLGASDIRERLAGLDDHSFRDRGSVEGAIGLIIEYLQAMQGGVPAQLSDVEIYRPESFVSLDPATVANLELFETLMGGNKRGSLFWVIDETTTAAGGRRLRTWLAYPLTDRGAIERRRDAVTALANDLVVRTELRDALKSTADIQRLVSRLAAGQGGARDLVAMRRTLQRVPTLRSTLDRFEEEMLTELVATLDDCPDVSALIEAAIVDDPPPKLSDGGTIREGYDAELDELVDISTRGKDWMLRYESGQKERTGIGSLKVKHNKVFGYYIEVTKANLEHVPDDYVRKQTLANSERYYTPELKEYEEKILTAEERRLELEAKLFEQVRLSVVEEVARLRKTADRIATLDALLGLAELSRSRDYVAPSFTDEREITIEAGRHPVVEVMVEEERFVPNDTAVGGASGTLHLITGPNMAGKSTVIRQVALISLLAQIGSHVPARSARLCILDQIFSRVGASDNLAKGQSTFMVEMSEAAHILQHATERSLVILDEIGRGTSTYDGLAIAWAVAEHLHDRVGAFTFFATHYHELTELSRVKDGVRNFSIAVKEWNDNIVFLRKLVEGPANRSYGIQVARLAGVPEPVVERAKAVLANLEAASAAEEPVAARELRDGLPVVRPRNQLNLFGVAEAPAVRERHPVVDRVANVALERMTPIEAFSFLVDLRKRARASEEHS